MAGPFYNTITIGGIVLTGDGYYRNTSFIAKLDTTGQFLWAQAVQSSYPTALATGPAGEVYMTGGINGASTFDATVLTAQGNGVAGFVARLDANGNFVWARKLAEGDVAHDVAVDATGNVFVAGGVNGLAVLDNVAISSLSNSRYYSELFLAKLDDSGQFLWARKAAGTSYYISTRLAVDGPGNAYLFTSFYSAAEVGTAKLYSGDEPLLLSKTDPTGHGVWVKQVGGDYQRAIAADTTGNVYLAANFSQPARFGDFTLTSSPSIYYNLYVAKICSPPPPVITAQPESLIVNAGTNATFSVTATNTGPLSYQWRKDGAKIPGATNATFTINNVQPPDGGDYGVLVSGDGGSTSSSLATLTVVGPYAGTLAFLAANYGVNESAGVATIGVMRTGSLTGMVTIEFGTGNGTALADVDYLATSGTLRFGDGESLKTFDVPILDNIIFESDKTLVLRLCEPKGGAMVGSITAATLTITNDDTPAPVIISQPRSRSMTVGDRATFSVIVSGQGPLHYQWRKNGAAIPGANGASYLIPSTQPGDAGAYAVIVTSEFGETFSQNAMLTLFPLPMIVEQPQGRTVERGSMVTLRVTASSATTVTQNFHRVSTSGQEDRLRIENAGSSGHLNINYDFFGLPDSLHIYYDYSLIFDSGFTNGSGSASLDYFRTYYGQALEVVVNEGSMGYSNTAWVYDLQVIPDNIRYQWRKNGALLGGATGPILFIPFATPDIAGEYTVTVRDNYGSVVSQPAVLTVVPPAPPLLHITRVNATDLRLSWESQNFYLEAAPTLNGTWNTLPSDGNSLVITMGDDVHFFRLRENYIFSGD